MSTDFPRFIRNSANAGHFGYAAWNQSHGCAKMSVLINKVAAKRAEASSELVLKN
ncbi:MAG TPA: hypothetical protein VM866_11515 [Pyrinomonadaceae bacterium]|nr:hypothetical protein [Pyrinomonadaceae bacterium]